MCVSVCVFVRKNGTFLTKNVFKFCKTCEKLYYTTLSGCRACLRENVKWNFCGSITINNRKSVLTTIRNF